MKNKIVILLLLCLSLSIIYAIYSKIETEPFTLSFITNEHTLKPGENFEFTIRISSQDSYLLSSSPSNPLIVNLIIPSEKSLLFTSCPEIMVNGKKISHLKNNELDLENMSKFLKLTLNKEIIAEYTRIDLDKLTVWRFLNEFKILTKTFNLNFRTNELKLLFSTIPRTENTELLMNIKIGLFNKKSLKTKYGNIFAIIKLDKDNWGNFVKSVWYDTTFISKNSNEEKVKVTESPKFIPPTPSSTNTEEIDIIPVKLVKSVLTSCEKDSSDINKFKIGQDLWVKLYLQNISDTIPNYITIDFALFSKYRGFIKQIKSELIKVDKKNFLYTKKLTTFDLEPGEYKLIITISTLKTEFSFYKDFILLN